MPVKPSIRREGPADDSILELLYETVFGPGRLTRAAQRIREQGGHDPALSFVMEAGTDLLGGVRLTPVSAGPASGHLLGPLAVAIDHAGLGHGKALVRHAVDAARETGSDFVILVGDEPYYGKLGFENVAPGRITLPGPVDPARLLMVPLNHERAELAQGELRHILRC